MLANIKKEMDRLDWKMSNLSRKAGVDYSRLHALLVGKSVYVSKRNIKKIATALGVKESKLLK